MDRIVIVFVPTDLTRQEIEIELKKRLAAKDAPETPEPPPQVETREKDGWPLWTWFIPNPCR